VSNYYAEVRPAYTVEASYRVLVTIDGSADLTAWTFQGNLYKPDGTLVSGEVAAAITSVPLRQMTVTITGQAEEGEYRWEVHRTDDGSNFVVATGAIEILSGVAYSHWQQVKRRVAESLHQDPKDLPSQFDGLCSRGWKDARGELRRIVILKGYSLDQYRAWDDRQVYEEMLGAFYALSRAAGLGNYPREHVESLDPRKELKEATALVISGAAVAPSANGEVGTIMYGQVTAHDDIVQEAVERGLFPE
jgi:hypothetical protein